MKAVNLADVDNSLNSLTTTYAGEWAGRYIAAGLLSANTLAQGGITVMPNIKYEETLSRLDLADALVPATCDFDLSADKVTITERKIKPTEFQINLQLCKKDFRSSWESAQMGISVYDNLPSTFAEFLTGRVLGQVAETIEHTIWKGQVGAQSYALFDGIVHKLADATASIPDGQEISKATINSSNVIAELGKVADAIPSRLYGKDDLFIFVPQNVARAYVRALGGFGTQIVQNVAASENVGIASVGANGVGARGTMWYNGGGLSIDGINIFVANGLADNTMVAAQRSNLYFGTGVMNDMNTLQLIDMAPFDGSQNVRMVLRGTAGVEIGIFEDVVVYA